MLTYRGFSAWITVDDKPLPEYLMAIDPEASRVSCWIPSENNKAFTVHWEDHGGGVDTCAFITLDGLTVPGRFLFGKGSTCRSGIRISPISERPFIFRTVQGTEEIGSSTNTKDIGMVTLRIKRVDRVIGRPSTAPSDVANLYPSHRHPGDMYIDFGQEVRSYDQCGYTWSVKEHNPENAEFRQPSTYVSFSFRYRSKAFLVSQGIMPEERKVAIRPILPRTPVRRIASAPVTPSGPISPQHPFTAPAAQYPPYATPNPSPDTKPKPLPKKTGYMRVGSQRIRRPSIEMRRTVSCRAASARMDPAYQKVVPLADDDYSDDDR